MIPVGNAMWDINTCGISLWEIGSCGKFSNPTGKSSHIHVGRVGILVWEVIPVSFVAPYQGAFYMFCFSSCAGNSIKCL